MTLATSVHAVAVAPATSAEATAAGILGGVAIVLDGDTLEVAGVPVRLYGIDAPESSQMCVANERRYQCGRQAAFELADRIAGQSVSCVRQASDELGMIVAVCSLEDERLNAWMVREGWALADPGHPDDYGAEEADRESRTEGDVAGRIHSAMGVEGALAGQAGQPEQLGSHQGQSCATVQRTAYDPTELTHSVVTSSRNIGV